MFSALDREAAAPAGPDRGRSGRGDGRDHGRPRAARADCRPPDRAGHERRTPARSRRPGADDAGKGDEAVAIVPERRVRYVRHGRRSGAHVQRVDGSRARRGSVRRSGREARQPLGLEPLRQRRPVRGARRQHRRAGAGRRAVPDDGGIAFFFAPTFHPSMRHAAPARAQDLGVRTAFNLLGPLTNPAGAARQLVGVPRPELTELVARSLGLLGSKRAWVVHGADGLDEISTTGYTKVSEYRDGAVNTFYLHPADVGACRRRRPRVPARRRRGRERAHRAGRSGRCRRTCSRDIVLLNAGASLLIAGAASDVAGGHSPQAAEALDAGRRERCAAAADRALERRAGGRLT